MRPFLIGFGVAVLFVLAGCLVYEQRNRFLCTECGSRKEACQWRVGAWPSGSVALSSEGVNVKPSRAYQDLFGTDHTHQWKFSQGSPYYWFGTSWGGCAVGGGRVNRFLDIYEQSPEFWELISTKRKMGKISDEDLRKIAGLPRYPRDDAREDPENRRLIQLGTLLLAKFDLATSRLFEEDWNER